MIPDASMIGLVRIQPHHIKRLLALSLSLADRPMGAVRSFTNHSTNWRGSPCMGFATQYLLPTYLRMVTLPHNILDFTDRALSG